MCPNFENRKKGLNHSNLIRTGDTGGRYRIHKVVVYLPNILMVAEETASPYAFLAWQVYTPLSSGYTDSRSRAT